MSAPPIKKDTKVPDPSVPNTWAYQDAALMTALAYVSIWDDKHHTSASVPHP